MAGRPSPPTPSVRPSAPPKSAQRFPWTAVGIFLAVGLYVYYLWLWLAGAEPVGAGILLAPLLLLFTVPLLLRANRQTPAFDLAGVMLVGLVMRFAFSYYRFQHAVDSVSYHEEGVRLASSYRAFNFDVATGQEVPGTGALRAISGAVHVFVADDFYGATLVMAWLSFLGCYLLYRAFATAMDDGDLSRYSKLIFLWPSMCFWPSSLGKDAWMVFTIGVASLGAARAFRRLAGGYSLLVIGLLGASFVRPHLALLAIVAFGIAMVIGRRQQVRAAITPGFIAKFVGIAVIIVIGSVLVSRTQQLLGVEDFSSASIESSTEFVVRNTEQGGSAFEAPNPRTPLGFVEAGVTVLFRPFPQEANGTEAFATALEGLLLAALTVMSIPRLLTVARRLRAQPYITYALVYVLLWILAFGIIGNFGILARQRTQMLPFYFVLLSVSAVVAKHRAVPEIRSSTLRTGVR
jgi:hypothetical protein